MPNLTRLRGIAGIRLPGRTWILPSASANGLRELSCQGIEEARIHEGIAGIELQRLRCQIDLGLDALAPRPADVLEIAEALHLRTRDRQDVIGIGRAEPADLPPERSDIQLLGAAEARFDGTGHDLLQRRIRDQECRDDTGARRVGACEFQRGRRTIGFGISGIGRHFRRNLVGAADHRIEAAERMTAVEIGADLVLKVDACIVEPAAARD